MELNVLEKAFLETDLSYRKLFRATFFSVKVLSKKQLNLLSPESIIFLAYRSNLQSSSLKKYIDELIGRMAKDESIKFYDTVLQYGLSDFLKKAFTSRELKALCSGKKVTIELTDLAERIYGENPASIYRMRSLKSLVIELSELKKTMVHTLSWETKTTPRYSNREHYEEITIFIKED